ncbi:MAG: cache domain-containing protein, partial [Candidatus Cloacimonetes bacterium]|nr:cache domain-containing protein [Candidatus Cloacimonadota bacterium]
MSEEKKRLSSTIFKGLFLLLILLFFALIVTNIIHEKYHARVKHELIRRVTLDKRKATLQQDTRDVIVHIALRRDEAVEIVKKEMRERVQNLTSIATRLSQLSGKKSNRSKILQKLSTVVNIARYHDGQAFFFLLNVDGSELLMPVHPITEPSLKDYRNKEGKFIFREIATKTKADKNGYFTLDWPAPGKGNDLYTAIVFAHHFAPLNIIIGTIAYNDYIEQKIQTSVIKTISSLTCDNRHILVFDYDGYVLSHNNSSFQNEYLIDYTNSDGVKVFRELLQVGRKKEGGFLEYKEEKPVLGEIQTKISYAGAFEHWEWIICNSIFFDDLY